METKFPQKIPNSFSHYPPRTPYESNFKQSMTYLRVKKISCESVPVSFYEDSRKEDSMDEDSIDDEERETLYMIKSYNASYIFVDSLHSISTQKSNMRKCNFLTMDDSSKKLYGKEVCKLVGNYKRLTSLKNITVSEIPIMGTIRKLRELRHLNLGLLVSDILKFPSAFSHLKSLETVRFYITHGHLSIVVYNSADILELFKKFFNNLLNQNKLQFLSIRIDPRMKFGPSILEKIFSSIAEKDLPSFSFTFNSFNLKKLNVKLMKNLFQQVELLDISQERISKSVKLCQQNTECRKKLYFALQPEVVKQTTKILKECNSLKLVYLSEYNAGFLSQDFKFDKTLKSIVIEFKSEDAQKDLEKTMCSLEEIDFFDTLGLLLPIKNAIILELVKILDVIQRKNIQQLHLTLFDPQFVVPNDYFNLPKLFEQITALHSLTSLQLTVPEIQSLKDFGEKLTELPNLKHLAITTLSYKSKTWSSMKNTHLSLPFDALIGLVTLKLEPFYQLSEKQVNKLLKMLPLFSELENLHLGSRTLERVEEKNRLHIFRKIKSLPKIKDAYSWPYYNLQEICNYIYKTEGKATI